MNGPADDHWSRLDDRAFDIIETTNTTLESNDVDYVLVGGWAVFSYGSNVPSVDTDIFLATEDAPKARDLLKAQGLDVGVGSRVEPLALDYPNYVLGPDSDFGDPEANYVPRSLLQGHTQIRDLDLPSGSVHAIVPNAPELTFTKLKAYSDRKLAWQALRDPGVMARLPPTDRTTVRRLTEGYYLRKAGKDLYDIGFLETHHQSLEDAFGIRDRLGLADWVCPDGLRPERPIRDFAFDLAGEDLATADWVANV